MSVSIGGEKTYHQRLAAGAAAAILGVGSLVGASVLISGEETQALSDYDNCQLHEVPACAPGDNYPDATKRAEQVALSVAGLGLLAIGSAAVTTGLAIRPRRDV